MGQTDSFQRASSAVWDGVRNAAAFVWFPLPLKINSTATGGKFWLNRIRTDLLRATTVQHRKGLVVKEVTALSLEVCMPSSMTMVGQGC